MKRLALLTACLMLFVAGCGVSAAEFKDSADKGEAAKTVLGKIKEINGNEILLALAEEAPQGGMPGGEASAPGEVEIPQEGEFAPPSGDDAPARPSGSADKAASDTTERPAQPGQGTEPFAGFSGGNRGGGMPGAGGLFGGASVTLTGEEAIYLIPVTASITTGQGDNAKTVRFTQLAVKNVIRIQLDENDTILSVEVLQ